MPLYTRSKMSFQPGAGISYAVFCLKTQAPSRPRRLAGSERGLSEGRARPAATSKALSPIAHNGSRPGRTIVAVPRDMSPTGAVGEPSGTVADRPRVIAQPVYQMHCSLLSPVAGP